MAAVLGKRKRRRDHDKASTMVMGSVQQNECLHQMLQKHFESKFEPLDIGHMASPRIEEPEELDEGSKDSSDDWEGISEDSGPETVDIVEHEQQVITDRWRERQERRAFMSTKPPSASLGKARAVTSLREETADDEVVEAANLKNDLALQRLLQESSLLKACRTDAHGTMPSALHPSEDPLASSLALKGSNRHKALDLRLQRLGAKDSLFKQRKMPLTHRLGIVEKQRTKEKERRQEARENGIVLERVVKDKKRGRRSSRRESGVGGPSVGRMKGGTLVLSRSDLRDIRGADNASSHKSKGSRRR